MRIISGNRKGRVIIAPRNLPVRPTTDKAKESLFNILHHQETIEGKEVLDLFAGTGNITFEFASRDCGSVTAVDINKNCISFIKRISEKLGFQYVYTIQSDYLKYIKHTTMLFDIIFADPPYSLAELVTIPDIILDHELLKNNGLLIFEHPSSISFTDHPRLADHRNYGRVNFSFFR